MLEFFRQHQRIFFLCTAFIVISSFLFFGAFSTYDPGLREERPPIGKALDGSSIPYDEWAELIRLISTDREDLSASPPNLVNDGVIRQDLLRTKVADLMVTAYFDELKEEIELRLEKARLFHPYSHPKLPHINVESIWERSMPGLKEDLLTLQCQESASPYTFSLLSRLYQKQQILPPELMRRILLYYQYQAQQSNDSDLAKRDLSLFGFHSLADWFGRKFIDLSAQFIWNAAITAEKEGGSVSLAEAKADLRRIFDESIEKASEEVKKNLSYEQQLSLLGMTEERAAKAWQKVLLFRRLFRSISAAAFVDSLPYQQFASFAKETSVVQEYSLPSALHLKNEEDLIAFETYCKAIAEPSSDPLALPTRFRSLEKVPGELIETVYQAKIAAVRKTKLFQKIGAKQLLSWQIEESHWKELKRHFNTLPEANDKKERVQALDRLAPAIRVKVDMLSRSMMLDQNPAWIEQALQEAPLEKRTLFVSPKQKKGPLLEKAAVQDPSALAALRFHTDDEMIYERIEEVEKIDGPRRVLFQSARERGLLKNLPAPDLKSLKSALGEEAALSRFTATAKRALAALKKNPNDPAWVKCDDAFENQFKFIKEEKSIGKCELAPQTWSSVSTSADGEISFFFLQEKRLEEEPTYTHLEAGKEILSADADRYFAERLLSILKQTETIRLQ